jgi:hypothetical protein
MSSDARAVPPDYSGSLLLVRAMSEAEAETEARRLALTEEDDYENSDGERVTWTFVDVLDVRLVSTRLRNGSEVYSWLMNEDVFSRVRSAF